MVKLFCTQEAAQVRLQLRNKGSDENQHRHPSTLKAHFNSRNIQNLHGNKIYDLELDNSDKSPEACAKMILERLKTAQEIPFTAFKENFIKQQEAADNIFASRGKEYQATMENIKRKLPYFLPITWHN